jgi:hypothetical protein
MNRCLRNNLHCFSIWQAPIGEEFRKLIQSYEPQKMLPLEKERVAFFALVY